MPQPVERNAYNLVTPAEAQIMEQVARGKGNAEIARILNKSRKTVVNQRMDLNDRVEDYLHQFEGELPGDRSLYGFIWCMRLGLVKLPFIQPWEPLRNSEKRILALRTQAYSMEEIAQQLVLSSKTVEDELLSVYKKLRVKNKYQAIAAAIQYPEIFTTEPSPSALLHDHLLKTSLGKSMAQSFIERQRPLAEPNTPQKMPA